MKSLGWMNGNLVPFDESYIQDLKRSPELNHFLQEMNEVVIHYIENSPYKSMNLRDKILLKKDLMTRDKIMGFVFAYRNPRTDHKVKQYVLSFDNESKYKIIKDRTASLRIPQNELQRLNSELDGVLRIESPYERLNVLYPIWLRLQKQNALNAFFSWPLGENWEGDIFSEEVKNLERETKRLYPQMDVNEVSILIQHYPGFMSYEVEVLIDTLNFLSMIADKTGSDIEMMRKMHEKIPLKNEDNPEIAENIFIFSKKHFNGSVIHTLNQLLEYQHITPQTLLQTILKNRKNREKEYQSTVEKISRGYEQLRKPKDTFLNTLRRMHILLYTDKYLEVKAMSIPVRKNFLPYRWFEVTEQMKRVIRELNPEMTEDDLSNFEGVDMNARSILRMEKLIDTDVLKQVIKDFEARIKS